MKNNQPTITLPVYFDGELCGNGSNSCPFAYPARFGWFCGGFGQLLERNKQSEILRCDKCHWQFDAPAEPDKDLFNY